MSVANDEDAQANDCNARPAEEIYLFAEEQESENSDHEIGKGRSRLDITVIRPGQHEHVGDKKSQQASDSKPDVAGGKNPEQNVEKFLRFPIPRGADRFHSFAEQHIAERGEQHDKEKKDVSFQVQAWRIFHAIGSLLPRQLLVLPLSLGPFILLDVRCVSKAPKGEIVRFLLFFCFRNEMLNRTC